MDYGIERESSSKKHMPHIDCHAFLQKNCNYKSNPELTIWTRFFGPLSIIARFSVRR
jgi:hypothetical protein